VIFFLVAMLSMVNMKLTQANQGAK
jgi:hypothetical protein